eukprot:6458832-Amphidinium_carterae.1
MRGATGCSGRAEIARRVSHSRFHHFATFPQVISTCGNQPSLERKAPAFDYVATQVRIQN